MPFTKGTPKPPNSGRKKGTPNRYAGDIGAFARSVVEDITYQANLLKRAQGGELAPPVETMLFAYAYGKPMEQRQDDRDDMAFMQALVAVVLKHAGSREARQEIRAVIEAFTPGGDRLRAVA